MASTVRVAARLVIGHPVEIRLHPRVGTGSTPAAMTRPVSPAYAFGVTAPTVASLERMRARQQSMRRLLRPLGFGVVVLVVVAGMRTHPRPGLSGGEHL